MPEVDPERLLTEALRAQAARTPLPEATGPIGAYGLLSGSDLPLAALAVGETTTRIALPEPPPRAWWVLGLAVLLGLAAGTLTGLLTLL